MLVADFVRRYNTQLSYALPLQETVVRQVRSGLYCCLASSGHVVDRVRQRRNLMLVRTASRDREVAIRMALGSSRSQLFSLIRSEAPCSSSWVQPRGWRWRMRA